MLTDASCAPERRHGAILPCCDRTVPSSLRTAGHESHHDIGGMAVEVLPPSVIDGGGSGSACRAAIWTSRSGPLHRVLP